MPKQKLEIECPVCDAKLSIDARSCPKCGADLRMADFQDLENLANDISGDKVTLETAQVNEGALEKEDKTETSNEPETNNIKVEPESKKEGPETQDDVKSSEKPQEEEPKGEEPVDEGKKKGLFSKFFGKKK